MKPLLIFLGAIILFSSCIMPITGYGIEQGFKHKDKGWAPKVVLVSARTRMRLMQYSQARPALEQFLTVFSKHPDQAQVYFWIGLCNEKEKNIKIARGWYERFLSSWPRHEWADQVRRRVANIDAGVY
jgi:outer membrane protein assembly factor BamD (BamD/ComL family)